MEAAAGQGAFGAAPVSSGQFVVMRVAGAGFFGCFGFFCSLFCRSRLPMVNLLSWRRWMMFLALDAWQSRNLGRVNRIS